MERQACVIHGTPLVSGTSAHGRTNLKALRHQVRHDDTKRAAGTRVST